MPKEISSGYIIEKDVYDKLVVRLLELNSKADYLNKSVIALEESVNLTKENHITFGLDVLLFELSRDIYSAYEVLSD